MYAGASFDRNIRTCENAWKPDEKIKIPRSLWGRSPQVGVKMDSWPAISRRRKAAGWPLRYKFQKTPPGPSPSSEGGGRGQKRSEGGHRKQHRPDEVWRRTCLPDESLCGSFLPSYSTFSFSLYPSLPRLSFFASLRPHSSLLRRGKTGG